MSTALASLRCRCAHVVLLMTIPATEASPSDVLAHFVKQDMGCTRYIFQPSAYQEFPNDEKPRTTIECAKRCIAQRQQATDDKLCTAFRFDYYFGWCDMLWFNYNCHWPEKAYELGAPPKLPPAPVGYLGDSIIYPELQMWTLRQQCIVSGMPRGVTASLNGRYEYDLQTYTYKKPGGAKITTDGVGWNFDISGNVLAWCGRASAPGVVAPESCGTWKETKWVRDESIVVACTASLDLLDPDKKGSWHVGLAMDVTQLLIMVIGYPLPPFLLGIHGVPDRKIAASIAIGTVSCWYAWGILQMSWSPFLHTDAWLINTLVMFCLAVNAVIGMIIPLQFWVYTYGRRARSEERYAYIALASVLDFRGLQLWKLEHALKAGADLSLRWKGRTLLDICVEKLSKSDEKLAREVIDRCRPSEAHWLRLQAHDIKGFSERLQVSGYQVPENCTGGSGSDVSTTGRGALHKLILFEPPNKFRLKFRPGNDASSNGQDVLGYLGDGLDDGVLDNLRSRLGDGAEPLQPLVLDAHCSSEHLHAAFGRPVVFCLDGQQVFDEKTYRALLKQLAEGQAAAALFITCGKAVEATIDSEPLLPVFTVPLNEQLATMEVDGQLFQAYQALWNEDLAFGGSLTEEACAASFGSWVMLLSQPTQGMQEPFALVRGQGSGDVKEEANAAAELGAVALVVCTAEAEEDASQLTSERRIHPPSIPVWYLGGPASKALWKVLREEETHRVVLPGRHPLLWLVDDGGEAGEDGRWSFAALRSEAHWMVEEEAIPVDTADDEGNTALHLAAWRADEGHIRELVHVGANRSLVNSYGLTPLQLSLSSAQDTSRMPAEQTLYRKEEDLEGSWCARLCRRGFVKAAKGALYWLTMPFRIAALLLAAPVVLWFRRQEAKEKWTRTRREVMRVIQGRPALEVASSIQLLRPDVSLQELEAAVFEDPLNTEGDEARSVEEAMEMSRAKCLITLAFGDACADVLVKDSQGRSRPNPADRLQLRSALSDEAAANLAWAKHPDVSHEQIEAVIMVWLYGALCLTYAALLDGKLRVFFGMRGISGLLVFTIILPLVLWSVVRQHPHKVWLWRARHQRRRKDAVVRGLVRHSRALLHAVGEQRLQNQKDGPQHRQWLRYLLEALVPLDSSGELLEAASRADACVSEAYKAVFAEGANSTLQDPSIPREALVNKAEGWQGGVHQALAHGKQGPDGLADRDVLRFTVALFEVSAFKSVEELSTWCAKEASESFEDFFAEGYSAWLLACARLANGWLEERMVKRFGHFGKDENGKYKGGPLKLLERVRVKTWTRKEQSSDLDSVMSTGGTTDLSRCSLTFDTAEELREAYEEMRNWTMDTDGMEPVRVTWDYHDPTPGYKDAKLLLLVPVPGTSFNHIVECQLLLRAALEIKLHSHLIYQVSRGDLGSAPPRSKPGVFNRLQQLMARGSKEEKRSLLHSGDGGHDERFADASGSGAGSPEPTRYGQAASASGETDTAV
eukprot:TRINITY_DN22288_c0_g1_i3.p1 TRINITY_DN22288_c0_g1~~TRINITY_DN22288_c0_g1_i3.p1  ORF type:complete len:1482 (+),score=285.66 TRINITY_DN22288_c0_g1_i3:94-4539(+)